MLLRKAINDFRFLTKTLLVIFALSGVAACSSDIASSPDLAPPPPSKHEIYRGPLYQSYRTIQDSPNREKCDQRLSDIQSTLITALDLKTTDILNYSYSQSHNTEELAPFGRSYLLNKAKIPATQGWQENPYSWSIAHDYFLKHKSENDSHFWTTLNAYVRSLITDDRKRIVYRYNYSLTRDHVEKLFALREEIETCKTNTRCALPDWSDDQKKLIAETPIYHELQTQLDTAYFLREKREIIADFYDQIQSDYSLHQFNFNEKITHQSKSGKHVFTLPLDASNFSDDDRSLLEKSVSAVWNNDLISVSIAWKRSTSTMNLFHFLFTYEPNNRSFVNIPLKEIQLFPFNTTRAVAHEIGHVLGFDDHYYTLWDSAKCEYREQFNDADIMSNPDTGDTTSAEWQLLMDQYKDR